MSMMQSRVFFVLLVLLVSSLSACSARRGKPSVCSGPSCLDIDATVDETPDAGLPVDDDAGPGDAGGYGDAQSIDPCIPGCGPTELCGEMGDGDSLDNDCDGLVDEDCTCVPGTSRGCFRGPPDRRNVGACADGTMVCTEFTRWADCSGGQFPVSETCDGTDNDCNGVPDDGLSGCTSTLTCPGSQGTIPLSSHLLQGSRIYTGAAESWRWEIMCPSGGTCPAPVDPNARDTSVYFVSSGSYRARLTIVPEGGGAPLSCEWVIYVQGAGLRVELDWDTQGVTSGSSDVDLHLHRRTVAPGVLTGETGFDTDDDCYYANCKGSNHDISWSMPDTADLAGCRDAPHGEGDDWVERGSCANPRLDVDVIRCNLSSTDPEDFDFCAPENINVDNPPPGSTFRVGVKLFSGFGAGIPAKPTLNIFCGGELRATLGSDVELTMSSSYWLAADVRFNEAMCGRSQCTVQPLRTATDGPVIQAGREFGPPWSF